MYVLEFGTGKDVFVSMESKHEGARGSFYETLFNPQSTNFIFQNVCVCVCVRRVLGNM